MKKLTLLTCLMLLLSFSANAETNINSLSEKQADYYCFGVNVTFLVQGSRLDPNNSDVYLSGIKEIGETFQQKYGMNFAQQDEGDYVLRGSDDFKNYVNNNDVDGTKELLGDCVKRILDIKNSLK